MGFKLSLLATAAFLTLGLAIAGSWRSDSSPPQAFAPLESNLLTQLPSQPLHPDEPLSTTLQQRLTLANALDRLQQLRTALAPLSRPTPANRRPPTLDPETATLAIPNWLSDLEGTLQYQNYQVKKLELDLAKKQFQDGEISPAELQRKTAAHQKAARDLQAFWQTFRIVD